MIVLNNRELRLSPWRIPVVVRRCCDKVKFVLIWVVVFVFKSLISSVSSFETLVLSKMVMMSFSWTLSKAFVKSIKHR